MAIDLVIVNPGGAHGIMPGHSVYGDLGAELVATEPPLWARLAAGYVRDRGHSVAIIDQDAERISAKEIARRVRALEPRLVAVTAMGHQPSASTQSMPSAREVLLALIEHNHVDVDRIEPTILIGGHVSALPERTLREEPVDYVCVGEGPETIIGVLERRSVEDIPGLVWRDIIDQSGAYDVRVNPRAPNLPMKELHGDVWDLLPMDRYWAHNWQCLDGSPRAPYASIITSLNCPYSCSFCCISAPFGDRVYRRREPTDVVAEMVKLHDQYGVKTFKFIDELFILNRPHCEEICDRLIATGFADEINSWIYGRTDTVRFEDLPKFRKAGFKWIAYGIESADATVQAASRKTQRADPREVVRRTQEAGINVIANFIFGLPEDTPETMRATLDLAIDLRADWFNAYVCQAYPGSPLYDQILAERPEDLPDSWAGYSQHNRHTKPLRNANLSAAEILRFRDAAFVEYFSHPITQAHLAAKFGAAALDEVERMLSYRLERDLLKEPA